jgi:hypothetical protein
MATTQSALLKTKKWMLSILGLNTTAVVASSATVLENI